MAKSIKTKMLSQKNPRKKEYLETDVLTAAYERMRYIFDSFDTVCVSFSGGKDSTVVLNIALNVASELNKLPLNVVFIDEEVITPPTNDYVMRLKQNPDINLRWLCCEIKQRNACSFDEPYWFTWDRTKSHLWTRPMPSFAETSVDGYDPFEERDSTGVGYLLESLFTPKDGKVATVTGVRTEESLRRYRALSNTNNDNFIRTSGGGRFKNVFTAHPIYDWRSTDIWLAIKKFGWDYSREYDVLNLTKLNGSYTNQRVCIPFGEEAMRRFDLYQECFPDMWAKICNRVAGVGAAVRYANDALFGANIKSPPKGMTWKEYMNVLLLSYNEEQYKKITDSINMFITTHYKKSILTIQDSDPCPLSGASWKFFCKCVLKGDFKGRLIQNMTSESSKSTLFKGFTLKEVIQKYGTEEYKSTWNSRTANV